MALIDRDYAKVVDYLMNLEAKDSEPCGAAHEFMSSSLAPLTFFCRTEGCGLVVDVPGSVLDSIQQGEDY